MENVIIPSETFTEPPSFDPYAFPPEEPALSDPSLAASQGRAFPAMHQKILPPLQQLTSSPLNMQYQFPDQHQYNSSAYQLLGQDIVPASHPQDLGQPKQEKKKKGKATGAVEDGKAKKPKKSKKVKDLVQSPGQVGSLDSHSQGVIHCADLPFSDTTYQSNSGYQRDTVLCAKTAAPQTSNAGDSSPLSLSYALTGSNFMSSSLPLTPPTNLTGINVIPARTLSGGRRQSTDSVDQSTSRPGSRASTVSTASSSDGKTREPVDAIPLSKVLEIIEREKALGSSSPCKRRRTAKPQHIQDAEEEAKKYTSSNNSSSVMPNGLTPQKVPTSTAAKPEPASGVENKPESHSSGFCCSTCKTDGSVSSKNCEKKIITGPVPSTVSSGASSEVSLKIVSSETYHCTSHSQPNVTAKFSHQIKPLLTNALNNVISKDPTVLASAPKHHKESAKAFPPNCQAIPGTDQSGKTLASPLLNSYQQNGLNISSELNTQVTQGFSDEFKHFLKTTAAAGGEVTAHHQALTACTTVVSSYIPVSSVLSSVKPENSVSGQQMNSQKSRLSPSSTPAHLFNIQPASIGSAFPDINCAPVPATSPMLSEKQTDLKNERPVSAKPQDSSWPQNSVNSGTDLLLPPINPSPSQTPQSQSQSGSTKPSLPLASAPQKPNTGHCQVPSVPKPPIPVCLSSSGPLPPFGAFAGLKADPRFSFGTQTTQYSAVPTQQDLTGLLIKKEACSIKKVKKKQKVSPKPQNLNGDYPNSKSQTGSTNTLSSGLKERNVKPLSGMANWSNMQQIMEDKNALKPVSNDYPADLKPTALNDSSDVKPVLGAYSKSLGTRVGGSAAVPPPASQAPPSPSERSLPGLVNLTPEEELADRLGSNRVENAPQCGCLGPEYIFNESIEGPYYTQLGTAHDMAGLRQMMEKRTGLSGKAIRLEKIHYTGKEGRSTQGCPIAKWIIRRSGPEEKYLCVARKRPGHFCCGTYIVVAIVAWEGVASQQADSLYNFLVPTLTKHGFETDRRCGTNEQKTCACQGADLLRRGASFSFGCSWSMYFNGCKFARSHIARKFKLKDTQKEEELEDRLQDLATAVGPLYKVAAPDAYRNQVHFEENASMCRLGKEKGRPFSGVTACVDFCAHSHKDFHNMQNGSTVVVTLTKHRGLSKPDDEQLHVLPLYVLDNTDEHGSVDGQMAKVQSGALEILHDYPIQARMRAAPLTPKRRGRQPKKESPTKRGTSENAVRAGRLSTPGAPTAPDSKDPNLSFNSQDSSQPLPDSPSGNNTMQSPGKGFSAGESPFVDKENSSASEDLLLNSFGPSEMYEKVWEYFYSNGTFPTPAYMEKLAALQKQAMINRSSSDWVTNNGAHQHSNHQGSRPTTPHAPSDHQREAAKQASPSPSTPQAAGSPMSPHQTHSHPLPPSSPACHGSNSSSPFSSPVPTSPHGSNPPSPFPSPAHSSSSIQGSLSQPGSPMGHSHLSCDGAHPTVCNDTDALSTPSNPVMRPNGSFVTPTLGQGPDEPTFTMMDPTVVKCEWQDNKESFHDPGIGGVAIALSHGAVLFEVAKRELHATTALKNPNRYQPTRISLVFYQHKNLNYYHHGYYEYERKLATQRQKRIEKLMEEGATAAEAEKAVKPGRKRKKKEGEEEEEKVDFAKTSAAQYRYMWETTVQYSSTLTTDSIITRWIDPQPMVTGPYQRWV